MHNTTMRPLLLLSLATFAWCASNAQADGKFFPMLRVTDDPTIQAQRAVVAFRDGHETLIVQSDIEGSGGTFGWIMPLPAVPDDIAPCEPGCLTVLANIIQPRIAHTPTRGLKLSLAILAATLLISAMHLLRRRRPENRQPRIVLAAYYIVITFLIFLALFTLLPSLSHSRMAAAQAVNVLQTVRAGVYDVSVIRGESGDVVAEWLTTNGFACPPTAQPVLNSYVADGWCFAAAKVAGDTESSLTHHPLRFSFPAEEAIYPMRLTGVDAEPIQLDLYVFAEQQAMAKHMRVRVCDSFRQTGTSHRFDVRAIGQPAYDGCARASGWDHQTWLA